MEYYSHYRDTDKHYQTNKEHQLNTANMCKAKCEIPLLKNTAYIVGLLHDAGKYQESWQDYFKHSIENPDKSYTKIEHSSVGGLVIDQLVPDSCFKDMAMNAIFMHHGINDCVSLIDGTLYSAQRKTNSVDIDIEQIKKIISSDFGRDIDIARLCESSKQDISELIKFIKDKCCKDNKHGSINYYVGMCERMLFSLLGDADVIDTTSFVNNIARKELTNSEVKEIWDAAIISLESKLSRLQDIGKDNRLNKSRSEISAMCKDAASKDITRYRLAVPTGAGKSMGSLRYALNKAKAEGKRHIFYVAPYRSVLDQNAHEIIDAIGNCEWVLEHHGDIIKDTEEEMIRYEQLIENWDEVPIIATTAVQFFNTLFKSRKRNIRRLHALCNSVIILDEIQAYPLKVWGLFNLAINFLTEVCNTSVVLCTATQPITEYGRENLMLDTEFMTNPLSEYEESFKRVKYEDVSNIGRIQWGVDEVSELIIKKSDEYNQVLAIFNTRAAARNVFENLKGKIKGKLYHLSTSMCPEHRMNVLREVKEALKNNEPVTCISTQIVEAGWDVSFNCVVRSMAGLDSIIQAAGRCNRNGKLDFGRVYLVRMNTETENLNSLQDIKSAQDATLQALEKFENSGFSSIDCEQMIEQYNIIRIKNAGDTELKYPLKSYYTDIVELLSGNRTYTQNKKYNCCLKQAFRTAGDEFNLIDEQRGINAVAIYGDADVVLKNIDECNDIELKKKYTRQLQKYIVGVPEKDGERYIHKRDDGIIILDERYYDYEIGFVKELKEMKILNF